VSSPDPTTIAAARELLAAAREPAPASLEILERACELREESDPAYARERQVHREIRAGIRDLDGRTADAAIRAANRGRYNAAWRCPVCNHLTSRKRGPCGCKCGCTADMGSVSCPEALDSR
jgi:rubrerythrin